MSKGKITVESGKYKAIFTISNENEQGMQDVQVNFEPPLNSDTSEEAIFVGSVSKMLIWYLKGGD